MTKLALLFEKQVYHLLALGVLLAALFFISRTPGFDTGAFAGVSTPAWLIAFLAVTVTHQVFVWICWRLQLHYGTLEKYLGRSAFPVYAAIFAVLIAARPVLITLLAIANQNTVGLNQTAARVIAVLMALPVCYLGYSIARYFSFKRAFGIDHFDPSYRTLGLVKKGIFRFSGNSMYTFGFLALWIPAIWCMSLAALAAAAFSHLYIWVHYFTTELPDLRRIYGSTAQEGVG